MVTRIPNNLVHFTNASSDTKHSGSFTFRLGVKWQGLTLLRCFPTPIALGGPQLGRCTLVLHPNALWPFTPSNHPAQIPCPNRGAHTNWCKQGVPPDRTARRSSVMTPVARGIGIGGTTDVVNCCPSHTDNHLNDKASNVHQEKRNPILSTLGSNPFFRNWA